jgi:putative endonuclease
MWTVYLIQHSQTKTLYVGVSSNVRRRLKEHNSNENHSTRRKEGTWILVYAESYRSKDDAYQREARLKKRGRAKQELLKRADRSLLA